MIFNTFCFFVSLIVSLEAFIILFDLEVMISKKNFIFLIVIDFFTISLLTIFSKYNEIHSTVILCC